MISYLVFATFFCLAQSASVELAIDAVEIRAGCELPDGLHGLVLSFLSAEQTYRVMIDHHSFEPFLIILRRHALLSLQSDAVDLLWQSRKTEIEACLNRQTVDWYWQKDEQGTATEGSEKALTRLRDVVAKFMRDRHLLSLDFTGYRLSISPAKLRLFPAVSLFAATLHHLDLRQIPVEDLRPLANLVNLESLFVSSPLVTDLRPLSEHTALKILCLDDTQVRDLRPLSRLTLLVRLELMSTPVEDVGPLEGLFQLEFLNLLKTRVSDLNPLANLGSLDTLCIDVNEDTDLAPIRKLLRRGLVLEVDIN